jgi:Predicted glutamine amidotransferase
MSANVPTDICFSFSGLIKRGGETGSHKDGWGIAFYEGKGYRSFHDPVASANSEVAKFIQQYSIKSTQVICHIRKANRGRVCLENTHPFSRELWGQIWSFAHNGQLKGIKKKN